MKTPSLQNQIPSFARGRASANQPDFTAAGRLNPVVKPATDALSTQEKLSPQQILNQRILESLNQELSKTGASPIETLDPADFSPEKVADRILGFVSTRIAQLAGQDNEAAQGLLAQAREGIERGFGEAKEILEGLGVFEGEVAENANRTYDLLQQGLDELENRLAGAGDQSVEQALVNSATLEAVSSSRARTEASVIQIETQDGDQVSIRLFRSESQQSSQFSLQDGSASIQGYSSSESASIRLEYVVEGNIDDEERAAINDLLGRIDQLSEEFFAGDVEEAFEQALELGFDTDELAGFALRLGFREEQAISAYQQTAEQAPGENLSQKLADFIQGFSQLLEPPQVPLFKNHGQAVKSIFTEMVKARQEDGVAQNLQKPRDLKALLDELVAALTSVEEAAEVEAVETGDEEVAPVAETEEQEPTAF